MESRWQRTIVHADMDAFYAAVEQLDDASLRGKPILVGPRSERGVVLTASYEARPFGVGSAMPMAHARRLCPQALIVPPRFERYQEVSKQIMSVFENYSPTVEPLSLDEAFLDMTGTDRIFGSPATVGERIKAAVREATGGLTVSVGISATKYVAKVASGYCKPDGLTVIPPESARSWLAPLPVSRLWGAGSKTVARLHALGFETIGDVAQSSAQSLADAMGSVGRHLHALALAEDPRAVDGSRPPQSIGSEITLSADTASLEELRFHLRKAADKVARRLRRAGYRAQGVRIKLKRHDFRLMSKQRLLAEETDVADVLFRTALALLASYGRLEPIRLVGLTAFDLAGSERGAQPDLLSGDGNRTRDLELALDKLTERFGANTVTRASELIHDRGIGAGSDLDFLRDRAKDTGG